MKDFKLSLALDPSSLGSNFNISTFRLNDKGGCEGPPTVATEYESWATVLAPGWLGEISTTDGGAVVSGWVSNGNADIMATKDSALDFSTPGQRLVGNVRLVLFHAPIR